MSTVCDKNSYFDKAVDRCAPCSQLCYAMNIQKTNTDCLKYCPDYLKSEDDNGFSKDVIIGIVVPSIIFIIICIGFIMWKRRRPRQPIRLPIQETGNGNASDEENAPPPEEEALSKQCVLDISEETAPLPEEQALSERHVLDIPE